MRWRLGRRGVLDRRGVVTEAPTNDDHPLPRTPQAASSRHRGLRPSGTLELSDAVPSAFRDLTDMGCDGRRTRLAGSSRPSNPSRTPTDCRAREKEFSEFLVDPPVGLRGITLGQDAASKNGERSSEPETQLHENRTKFAQAGADLERRQGRSGGTLVSSPRHRRVLRRPRKQRQVVAGRRRQRASVRRCARQRKLVPHVGRVAGRCIRGGGRSRKDNSVHHSARRTS
jgi:hypothetical protein